MSELTDHWHNMLLNALADEDREVRECISDFLAIETVDALLTKPYEKWRANALATLPKAVIDYVTTDNELICFNACIQALFTTYCEQLTHLKQPNTLKVFPVESPLFHGKTIPIGIIEQITKRLYQPQFTHLDAVRKNDEQILGRWLLVCALESNVNQLSALNELALLLADSWHYFPQATAISALLPNAHQRVWLRPMGALLFHYLSSKLSTKVSTELSDVDVNGESVNTKKLLKGKKTAKTAIKHYLKDEFPELCEQLKSYSVEAIVREIGLLHQPAGLHDYWHNEHSLSDAQLIRLFTDQPQVINNGNQRTPSKLSLPTHLSTAITNAKAKSDIKVKREVNTIFRHYSAINEKNDRRNVSFKQSLLALKNCQKQTMSVPLWLAVSWVIELFEHGSPWKAKLASSTLIKYFSDCYQFIAVAFNGCDFTTLSAVQISARCQSALDAIPDMNRQLNCIRFLHYINRYSMLPTIETEHLNLTDRNGIVRSNYLSPNQFDSLCTKFKEGKGYNEGLIVLFMQLCYYGWLREDEVLSLKVGDIDVECGLLHITPDKERKTKKGVRKFPLCLFPETVLKNLLSHQAQRLSIVDKGEYLFEAFPYAQLEQQFIDFVRNETLDETWVTHLFRHCGANNGLLLFGLATGLISDLPKPFAHEMFSTEHLDRVNAYYQCLGTPLDTTFPVLDEIALLVGHAGPATTLNTYLHLVDFFVFQMNLPLYAVDKKEFMHLISADSNYGFELAPRLTIACLRKPCKAKSCLTKPCLTEPCMTKPCLSNKNLLQLDKEKLLSWLIQKQAKSSHFFPSPSRPHLSQNTVTTTNKMGNKALSLTDFIHQLSLAFKGAPDEQLCPTFTVFIKNMPSAPTPLSLSSNQYVPWLHLCQQVEASISRWTSIEANALKQLNTKLNTQENITTLRALKQYVAALDMLGINKCYAITISGMKSEQFEKWEAVIKESGRSVHLIETDTKALQVKVRPYRLNWALWPQLPEIIDVMLDYQVYRKYLSNNDKVKSKWN